MLIMGGDRVGRLLLCGGVGSTYRLSAYYHWLRPCREAVQYLSGRKPVGQTWEPLAATLGTCRGRSPVDRRWMLDSTSPQHLPSLSFLLDHKLKVARFNTIFATKCTDLTLIINMVLIFKDKGLSV